MPRLPGIGDLIAALQAQTEALAALPGTVAALNRSVRGLGETVASARDTMVTLHRLTARVDQLLDEIEQPLQELAPGLSRVARILDDPVIDTLPEAARELSEDILPLVREIRDTHAKVSAIASSTERLVGVVDGAGRSLATLPAAALFGRRRSGKPEETGAPPGPEET